jgi:hypothetical protein
VVARRRAVKLERNQAKSGEIRRSTRCQKKRETEEELSFYFGCRMTTWTIWTTRRRCPVTREYRASCQGRWRTATRCTGVARPSPDVVRRHPKSGLGGRRGTPRAPRTATVNAPSAPSAPSAPNPLFTILEAERREIVRESRRANASSRLSLAASLEY